MSNEFQEVEDLEGNDTRTKDKDGLFDELEIPETEAQAETDVDPTKVRRELIKQGKEQLKESDFKNSVGNWKEKGEALWGMYQNKLSIILEEEKELRSVFDDDDFVNGQLILEYKKLVVGKGVLFKGFLPGGTGGIGTIKESEPKIYIPELEKFRELVNAVNKATKEWAKGSPEVATLIKYTESDLQPFNEDGTRATFTKNVRGSKGEETTESEVGKLLVGPYIYNKNDWPPYIKQNFEEIERKSN